MTRAWTEQSLLERMVSAAERVLDRLKRATAALEAANVPYAVIGGNAVAAWVATVDPSAVRNTPDVDILLRRDDLDLAANALAAVGFLRTNVAGIETFLDGPDARPKDAVHIIFASEKVCKASSAPAPDIAESKEGRDFRLIALDALVGMKLVSFRIKDKVHLRDMLDVGLIDASWPARFSADLAARLQLLIDTPEG